MSPRITPSPSPKSLHVQTIGHPQSQTPQQNIKKNVLIQEQIYGTRAKSQQIVATRLLYCLQSPVPYSSRLQRIYPLPYLKL